MVSEGKTYHDHLFGGLNTEGVAAASRSRPGEAGPRLAPQESRVTEQRLRGRAIMRLNAGLRMLVLSTDAQAHRALGDTRTLILRLNCSPPAESHDINTGATPAAAASGSSIRPSSKKPPSPDAQHSCAVRSCSDPHTMSGSRRSHDERYKVQFSSDVAVSQPPTLATATDGGHKHGFTCTDMSKSSRNQVIARRCDTWESNAMAELKEVLLKHVDGLRDLARRSRRLSPSLSQGSDRQRLHRHTEELEESASRIEGEAASAKTMNVARAAGLKAAVGNR